MYIYHFAHIELGVSILFHGLIFLSKNLIVFILINPIEVLSSIPDKKNDILIQVLPVFVINLIIIVGFLEALLEMNIIKYKNSIITAVLLYSAAAANCFQILFFYQKNNLFINWMLVIYIGFISLFEFILTIKIIKILEPVSLKLITAISTDTVILNAYLKRKLVKSLRLGILALLLKRCLYFLTLPSEDLGNIFVKSLLAKHFLVISMILNMIILISGVVILLLLSINLDNESLSQRYCILVFIGLSMCCNIILFIDKVISSKFNFPTINLSHFFMLIYYGYAFIVVMMEMRTLNVGLKAFHTRQPNIMLHKL